jgi:two-component system response regulator GlrR
VSAELVQRALRGRTRKFVPFDEARDRFEFDYLVQLLHATKGNVTRAAKLAERNRSEFYTLLNKHRLDPESFRGTED